MGSPANLPGFDGLTKGIAKGTGTVRNSNESLDQYLGRLSDHGTEVHERAAQIIQDTNPKPTSIHKHLLQLYGKPQDTRIVTTNFDLLFEDAARDLFSSTPDVFRAPALPLGNDITGIVHLHGSIVRPRDTILTHRDFGRAYLTESDGWARRFLVELFRNYIILFVGYSHKDTIVNYLTPSVPRYDSINRFALVGGLEGEIERWHSLGITPITFVQQDKSDFTGLSEGLAGLSNFRQTGVLGWKREITEVSRSEPPMDPELADKMEHALHEPHLLRYFVQTADKPEWIEWLDSRHYLDRLTSPGKLEEVDSMLATWLAKQFMFSQPERLFDILRHHGGKTNPRFWNILAHHVCEGEEDATDKQTFSQWVHYLMSTAPPETEHSVFLRFAERCKTLDLVYLLPQIYAAVTTERPLLRPGTPEYHGQQYIYYLQKLREECLSPAIPEIGKELLDLSAKMLKERHIYLTAWNRTREDYDPDSWRRPAIEPHDQNRFLYTVDLLVDVARNCLDWLVKHHKESAARWSCQHRASDAPLLRRLAIHALAERTDLFASEKLSWVLKKVDPFARAERHEIFRLVFYAYPQATSHMRSKFLNAILTYKPQETVWFSSEDADYEKYNWLVWLNRADPKCPLVAKELEVIQSRYKVFTPREHPDLNVSIGRIRRILGKPSPWTVSEILELDVHEWLSKALAEDPQVPSSHPRDQLVDNVAQAAEQDPNWGLSLARKIEKEQRCNTPLVQGLVEGWVSARLGENNLNEVFKFLGSPEVQQSHYSTIARSMEVLMLRNREVISEKVLASANIAAKELWKHIPPDDVEYSDLLVLADNHPAGQLARFWLQSIALLKSAQYQSPHAISEDQRETLSEMIADEGIRGIAAKVQLAGNFHLLAQADEEWSLQSLIPMLEPGHKDFAHAWEGLARSGLFPPQFAEMLREPFLMAVGEVNEKLSKSALDGFVAKYSQMVGFFSVGATDHWVVRLFALKNKDWNISFALEIGRLLNFLDEEQQLEWWQRWLKEYWENRVQGVPLPLDQIETNNMLGWALKLTGVFPEAARIAGRMPLISSTSPVVLAYSVESELPERCPNELAMLIIELGKSNHDPWGPAGIEPIIRDLMQQDVPEETRLKLDEIKAQHAIG